LRFGDECLSVNILQQCLKKGNSDNEFAAIKNKLGLPFIFSPLASYGAGENPVLLAKSSARHLAALR
jgi:hypothetical protein